MLKKVVIEAGHGGKDPGAVKYEIERDLNIKVVKYATTYLKTNYTCEVQQDITADSTSAIAARANKWGADLLISVHFNAGGGDGYEALVYSSTNLKLAKAFEKRVIEVGQNSRGVKYRPDLNILKSTNMPAILNEIAFVDNKKDINDWNDDKELKIMGEALAKAAADYLKLKEKKKSSMPVLQKYKTKGPLNIRIGPGTSYKRIDRYKKNTTINVYDYNKEKTWGYTKKGWSNITDKYATKVK